MVKKAGGVYLNTRDKTDVTVACLSDEIDASAESRNKTVLSLSHKSGCN